MIMTKLEITLSVLGSLGALGSVAALFKIRPEVARTTVSAAEGAVIVQAGVISALRSELDRINGLMLEERADCEKREKAHADEVAKIMAEVQLMRLAFSKIDERRSERRTRSTDEHEGGNT